MAHKDNFASLFAIPKNPLDFSSLLRKFGKQTLHKVREGTMLFNSGDPLGRVYVVKSGFIKLYRLSEEGRETTSYLLGPGYLIGVRALFSEDEHAWHNAEAITDATYVTLSRKEFITILETHPEHMLHLIYVFLDRLTFTEQKLEGFIFSSTTARVANFLADCAKRFGVKKNDGIYLPLELTHQRLAEFVGAFRETVTIALHRLEDDNIIVIKKSYITIRDIKKLRKVAHIGRTT